MTSAHSNHLVNETSPYLRQHVHNPVDWYPWGPEALEHAKKLNRPIFLSIGYSACHWCHVMEHESFEDTEVADVLNTHFVSIKVDREERPDLDQIYMTAVQMLTGQGGWPMSVFLTPDLAPFYGGTYFPPTDSHGRPSFKRLLQALIEAWKERKNEVLDSSRQIAEHLRQSTRVDPQPGDLGPDLIRNSVHLLGRSFDRTYGGFGSAPKFPHAMDLRLLLRSWKRFDDDESRAIAVSTLDHMAMGGMYDQLGGGFHRYSTDERWLVPHFEKMLYDNALLTSAYVEGYQATGNNFYREVVEETLDYVRREMMSPEGAFFSTQDADSEGVEGKFFVWSQDEIDKVLDKDEADVFKDVFGVAPEGNWEGHNILFRSKTYEQESRLGGTSEIELRQVLTRAKKKLLDVRSKRVWPARDEKILTSWNGLMIDALAQAAQTFENSSWRDMAIRAAEFIVSRMKSPQGLLYRTYSAGVGAKLNAYFEDYSFLLHGLISLYEATFDPRWIEESLALARVMIDQFWDDKEFGFYYTGSAHEELIARTKDLQDSSIPSSNSMAVTAFLRLSKLTGNLDLWEKAERTLNLFKGILQSSPMAAGQMLIALDFYLGPVPEFALVGDPSSPDTRRVLKALQGTFLPNKVVALKLPSGSSSKAENLIQLLKGKKAETGITTYICQNFRCEAPLVGPAAVEKALASDRV